MPLGREKDSSDRFHPATRKASTVLREEDRFHLPPSPSPCLLLPLRPTLVSAAIFSSFQNRLRRRGQWSSPSVRPSVPRENAPIVSRSNGGNRAVSSLPADHFARANFRAEPPSEAEEAVFTAKPPPRGIYCHRFAGGCVSRKQIRRDVVINPFSLESYLNTGIRAVATKIILLRVYVKSARASYTHVCGPRDRARAPATVCKRAVRRVMRD